VTETVPPIPVWLAHLPTVGGLAVPWVTAASGDGRYLFGVLDADRQRQCLTGRRCQVCGRPLGRPLVLLLRLVDLPRQRTSEPGLHPVCAAYTQAACPMVAGRMSHYRATPIRTGAGMAPVLDSPARLGAAADPWFAVWLTSYNPIIDPVTGQPAASYTGIRPRRIRPITWQHLLPW